MSRKKQKPATPPEKARADFPVVGIGASAGGLEPLKRLLRALPEDTGMAFVLVQHLSPDYPSMLPEILGRETPMPVEQVVDEPEIRPDHVYVIPPDRTMLLSGSRFRLHTRNHPGAHHPIDAFFRSLAEERHHRSIGVVLSGTLTDGTSGLDAIKAEGGITFAQDDSAQHRGMPQSAIAAGCVDFILPPAGIAAEIARISRHPLVAPAPPAAPPGAAAAGPPLSDVAAPEFARILELLRDRADADFARYRANTLNRRIARRMLLSGLNSPKHYVELLERDPAEVAALCQDILIGVTSFFRDPGAFQVLDEKVFPRLAEGRPFPGPLRVWVLGCSTGEEAYSVAIALDEFTERAGRRHATQIFATDLNLRRIEKARVGLYPKTIAAEVSPERLRRYFVEQEEGYRIAQTIRDRCIFARHNVLADPPFSRLDLVSCRNLLIYMEPPLQEQTLQTFHYALNPGGCLWLGASETVGSQSELFDIVDPRHRIYARKPGARRLPSGAVPGTFGPRLSDRGNGASWTLRPTPPRTPTSMRKPTASSSRSTPRLACSSTRIGTSSSSAATRVPTWSRPRGGPASTC